MKKLFLVVCMVICILTVGCFPSVFMGTNTNYEETHVEGDGDGGDGGGGGGCGNGGSL